MSVIDKFSSVKILCIGDVMLDRFIGGDVKRISPESPVPVISINTTAAIPGGAANVARNISSLSGQCTLVGLIGKDEAGQDLLAALGEDPRISIRLIEAANRPTTEKIRYVAQGQHIIRADRECADGVPAELEDELLAAAQALLPDHHVVILSDYAKGVLSDRVIGGVIRFAREHGVPVIVDPKSARLERYSGATLITPNSKEVQVATGLDPAVDDESAVAAGQSILQRTTIESILVTRGDKGMTLITRKAPPVHIAASAREVSDVVGAGDTVIATLSLALGAATSLEDAAFLANTAAGIAVAKHGTATVTRTELLDEFFQLERFHELGFETRLLSWDEASSRVALWRRDGLRIGFTNGCFDILHVGHLRLLNFARSNCDRLIVGLNSDASTRRLKGPTRPVNSETDRAHLIAALNMVDAVIVFDQDTPQEIIEHIIPDVLVKGADYELKDIVGADFVLSHGGCVLRCELVPDRSTTKLIASVGGGSAL
ncbi:D-glycero-beta-D-manno-heptose-7-phosphate kinase [Methyloferula stellata]|uniref:D-glycero-beta-D-manno-heptose-7-phosphate kinase n=1 Tax=Methyloferula stellata TaxID=876270 RepID=UPI00036E43D1|nr:D-glycero-beta-D-manno-heptose-7-phosphate kinase [Methyloferula stellata]